MKTHRTNLDVTMISGGASASVGRKAEKLDDRLGDQPPKAQSALLRLACNGIERGARVVCHHDLLRDFGNHPSGMKSKIDRV
jgi:hypothetical protein